MGEREFDFRRFEKSSRHHRDWLRLASARDAERSVYAESESLPGSVRPVRRRSDPVAQDLSVLDEPAYRRLSSKAWRPFQSDALFLSQSTIQDLAPAVARKRLSDPVCHG
ncbi:hypothetical protein D9M68_632140 [compost metagenome]